MSAIENYKRTKALSSKYSRMRLNGFLLNGSVYVHYDPVNFKPRTNVAEIDKSIASAYRGAASKMKSVASKNMGTTEVEAVKIIDELKQVIEGKIGNGRTASKIEKGSGLASKERAGLEKQSFSVWGNKARNAKDTMVFDAEQLSKYIKELEKLIEQVAKVPPDVMVKVAKEAEMAFGDAKEEASKEGATEIARKKVEDIDNGYFQFTKGRKSIWYDKELDVIAPDFNLIPNSGKANTSLLRLITGYNQLKNIHAKGEVDSQAGTVNHIMSKLAGLINSVGTSGQEVAIAKSLTYATILASEEIKKFVEGRGYAKTAVRGTTAGETNVTFTDQDLPKYYDEMSDLGKSIVSKSDVNIVFRKKGKTGAELDFNFGLNIKDYKTTSAGTISPTFLGSGNYKDFLIRGEIYKTALEYDLINSIAQKFSKAELRKDAKNDRDYDKKTFITHNYDAIKKLVAARTAFSSIGGLGNKKDTAYLVVFTNKVITTHSLFSKMADGTTPRLNLTIANEDKINPYVNSFVETPADVATDAYIRSRKILDIAYADFKVKVSGTKMKL